MTQDKRFNSVTSTENYVLVLRSPLLRQTLLIVSVLLMTVGTFVLPYAVPVTPSLSQSWAVGFSNRTALICFLLGALICAFLSRTPTAARPQRQSKLPVWTFWLMMIIVLLVCLAWGNRGGPEALYLVDRQLHLSHGEQIYRGFEFVYGPLLLYPGLWFGKLFHLTVPHAYYLSWKLQFVLGTALFWYSVANIDMPVRFRGLTIGILFLFQVAAIQNGGLNYTPFRSCAALALVVATHKVWCRTRSAVYTAIVMVLSIALGFAVSAEQGSGLAIGLCGYALLLAWKFRTEFKVWALVTVLCGAAFCFSIASKVGIFDTTRSFAAGAYCFPLLPSPANFLILATYVCGLGVFVRALRQRNIDQVAVPLALCGIPMLASAFGRCDVGHLMSATPLFILGAFSLTMRPRFYIFWAISMCSILGITMIHRLQARAHIRAAQRALHSVTGEPESGRQPISLGKVYYAPLLVPRAPDYSPRWNADSGFYTGLTQLSNVQQFTLKRDEIVRRRSPLLLVPDTPDLLAAAFWGADTNPDSLHALELSPWVPKCVHALPSAAVVSDAIYAMYKPTSQREDGWRVWALR